MEAQKLHRGRLIDHIQLVVEDLAASRRFYEAVFQALNIPIGGSADDYFWADELFVSSTDSKAAQGKPTGRHHLAFQAKDRAQVEAFYKAALANGGTDNGAPGERPYHPGYYAAFVLDPAGNNIEAVHHGLASRSSPSVTIEFES
jgi:catechol 2,3-dioxygenase-like lactoylglutathione lyase family enzyme